MPPETKIPNNAEIDQALKEFEAKSGVQPIPQTPEALKTSEIPIPIKEVSGIQFDTDSYKVATPSDETDAPGIIRLVIKYSGGLIKNQKTAEYLLFGFVILAMGISFYLFFGGGGNNPQPPSAAQLEQMRQMQTKQ